MNVNFGLMPPIEGRTKKADRKRMYTDRARAALWQWLGKPEPAKGDEGGSAVEASGAAFSGIPTL